jgi:3-hydroxybutyryl-CoA dehydrogenase
MKEIQTVAVIGAGTMGLGIAQVCAQAGYTTSLFDTRPEQTTYALTTITNNLAVAVDKGKIEESQRVDTLERLILNYQLEDVEADLVIEAAVEKLEVKQQLFLTLEKANKGQAILASNTSSISITQIAMVLQDPTRCIGLHFFNPADRMKLVEIVSGTSTDPNLVGILKEFCVRIKKTAVVAKDSPGFIVNRVARPYYVEALKFLDEKAGTVGSIDALMRSAGFRMGPFELMDLIGLDTNLAVTTSVYEGFNKDSRFTPSPIQQQLVNEGNLGRKSGKGFYSY